MDISTLIKVSIVSGAVIAFLACKYIWNLPASNPVEHAAEEIIKDETGVDLITTSTQQEEKK